MDKASSIYVDQIASEKLINEKLKRVHHTSLMAANDFDTSFEDIDNLSLTPQKIAEEPRDRYIALSFESAIQTPYPENNLVQGRLFQAEKSLGDIIFIHGLYEESLQIYHFFISLLKKRGINVYLLMLPYHYERKPALSMFSGEFFWSADLERNALAFKQSVYDLIQFYHYVKQKVCRPVWICGFSMGGGIGLTLLSMQAVDGLFCINPVCNIADLVWNSLLFSSIKDDLVQSGFTLADIEKRYRIYEPLNIEQIKIPLANVVIAKGMYDQINDPRNYDLLIKKWQIINHLSYKAGHLNILRVPKLAMDLSRCYFGNILK